MPAAPVVQRLTFEDFSGGVDRRGGLIQRDARRFNTLVNVYLTSGKKIAMRPPSILDEGTLDSQTQGGEYLNGSIITVAPAGTTVNHTLTEFPVETLYFDVPDDAVDWELISLKVFGTQATALILHQFGSSNAPWRLYLHIWDGKRPTWVTDSALPASWSPIFPQQAYGPGTAGAYDDYRPALVVVGNRLGITRADTQVGVSGILAPRVWNTRSPAEILSQGIYRTFIVGTNSGTSQFTVDIPFDDLGADQKWAAYVCEYMTEAGTWTQLTETVSPTLTGEYGITAVTNRFNPADPTETLLTIIGLADGTLVRFRALAQPPLTIQSGNYLTPNAIIGGIVSLEGANYTLDTVTPSGLTPGQVYYVTVTIPGAPIVVPQFVAGTVGVMPLNGQQRYWARIIAVAQASSPTAFTFSLTGTVSTAANSDLLTGSGTSFTTQCFIGRSIIVAGQVRTVKTISSDTELEVTAVFPTTASGQTALLDVSYQYAMDVGDAGNAWYAGIEAEVTLSLSGKDDAASLPCNQYDHSGVPPVALAAMQDRLLVQFRETTQLWQVGELVTEIKFLASVGQGAGPNTAPEPALVDGLAALPTSQATRLYSPSGLNKDYLDFTPVGDALRGIDLPDMTRAVWWSGLRVYLTTDAASGRLYCFSLHRQPTVSGWSWWDIPGLTTVDRMFVAAGRLVIISGTAVRYLDVPDASTVFLDDNTEPISAQIKWNYNDFGEPRRNKRLVSCDASAVGEFALAFYVNPSDLADYVPGPTIDGQTMGLQRVPLMVLSPAVAIEVTSHDSAGFELNGLSIDYRTLNR